MHYIGIVHSEERNSMRFAPLVQIADVLMICHYYIHSTYLVTIILLITAIKPKQFVWFINIFVRIYHWTISRTN